MAAEPSDHLAIFLPSFERGGVERMLVNLAGGIAELGVPVDLVVMRSRGGYLDSLDARVRLVELGQLTGRALLHGAAAYLRDARPTVMLASKTENDSLALAARAEAGVGTRIAMRAAVDVTGRLRMKGYGLLRIWWARRSLARIYRGADSLIAVSQGVAADLASIAGVPVESINVIHNPVITPRLLPLARAAVDHPWFLDPSIPVVIGIGRLGNQKNFGLLIRAFARVHAQRPCRLMILGEGRHRARLERLVRTLGLASHVAMPGFAENPYAMLSRARLFVLSSLWEGSPNVLTEALALGVPVVATDCPSGPREILDGGRYGALVPLGDENGLARAMLDTLEAPHSADFLTQAVSDYTVAASARHYLDVLRTR